MKTLTFDQMEQVNGGKWYDFLNPIPGNLCEATLGMAAGVWVVGATMAGGPLAGLAVALGTNALIHWACESTQS